MSEYSYNQGSLRENVATESFDYGDPGVVGLHRLGLSDSVTAVGLSAEATRGVANAGATVAAVLRPFEIEASGGPKAAAAGTRVGRPPRRSRRSRGVSR